MFSRHQEKKTSKNIFDVKQSSLEEFLLQDPVVHAKYQIMKKQYLLLSENNVTSDADKNNLSKPMEIRDENQRLRSDDGIPHYIMYLFAFFAFGFLIYFVCKK